MANLLAVSSCRKLSTEALQEANNAKARVFLVSCISSSSQKLGSTLLSGSLGAAAAEHGESQRDGLEKAQTKTGRCEDLGK